jgi:tetratricopeptide (TPR) repeat protein
MALHVVGRLDEAIEAFEKAIALNPEEPESYKNLVLTKRSAPGDPHIDAMQRLAQRMEKLAAVQQITLHFGLGKMYADLQMNEASFRYLLVGNTLQRRQVVYDEGNALRQLDRIRCVYTAELIATRRGHGHPSALPIFIFGMPRSGTTLVEQILASHPAVFGAGELPDLPIRMDGALGGGAIAFPEHVLSVPEDFFNELGARHVERLATLAPAASRVTDKTPTNFRIAGLIHLALPRAHMIHVRRDPVDTCLSCFSLLFGRGLQPQTYDLGELGRYYRAYERLMEHWRMVLPAGAMLEVHYEDIVADLEGQARRLVRYCGLEWDKACLSFHKTQRPVRTASAIQVRQPIYVTSVGRWRPPENVLHPLLVGLGH